MVVHTFALRTEAAISRITGGMPTVFAVYFLNKWVWGRISSIRKSGAGWLTKFRPVSLQKTWCMQAASDVAIDEKHEEE
jgi:hypothetical protein